MLTTSLSDNALRRGRARLEAARIRFRPAPSSSKLGATPIMSEIAEQAKVNSGALRHCERSEAIHLSTRVPLDAFATTVV